MEKQVDPILWHAQVFNTKAAIQTTVSAILLECFREKKKSPVDYNRLHELLQLLDEARSKFTPTTFHDEASMIAVITWCKEIANSLIPKS